MAEVRVLSQRHYDPPLARTAHVRPLRAGEDVMPIPLFNLHRPVGDLLRAGYDHARERVHSLMVERIHAMASNGAPCHARATIRTPHGVLRLTLLHGRNISVRLTVAPRVWLTSGELVLSGVTLPSAMQQAAAGRPIDDLVQLPDGHPLSGLAVTGVRVVGAGTRLRLDMPVDEIRLRELGEDPHDALDRDRRDAVLAMTRREALALAA